MNHTDLIKRIQNSAKAAGMPPDIAERIGDNQGNEWRDTDRQAGFVRYEFKVPISKLRNAFSKLFRRT